jgi:hypothetical protein
MLADVGVVNQWSNPGPEGFSRTQPLETQEALVNRVVDTRALMNGVFAWMIVETPGTANGLS